MKHIISANPVENKVACDVSFVNTANNVHSTIQASCSLRRFHTAWHIPAASNK